MDAHKLEELKVKIKGSTVDVAKVDQYLREIKNELFIKRNQVSQLTKDLDETNVKNFDLTHQLDSAKSMLKEIQFTLSLSNRNLSLAEESMKNMKDAYFKIKIKEELRSSEINVLNDKAQTLERERYQQTKEIEELKEKLNYSHIFQRQIEDRYQKLKIESEGFQSDVESLKVDHLNVHDIAKALQCCKQIKEINRYFIKDNETLKKQKNEFENAFIEISAKYERLEQLLKANTNLHEQNLIAKIKFLQSEIRSSDVENSSRNIHSVLCDLTENLNAEIATNAKLLIQNEEQELKICQLEKKLLEMKMESTGVKQEVNVIEITDE